MIGPNIHACTLRVQVASLRHVQLCQQLFEFHAVGQYKQVQGIIDSSIVDSDIKIPVPKGLNVTFDPPTAPKIKNRKLVQGR